MQRVRSEKSALQNLADGHSRVRVPPAAHLRLLEQLWEKHVPPQLPAPCPRPRDFIRLVSSKRLRASF